MQLTVELPNDLTLHPDPAREALEAFVTEAVRTHALTRPQGRTLLHHGRIEFRDFLIRNGVTDDCYGVEDLANDIKTGDELRANGLLPG
jgi:hypothetical protein